jgi:hypothetical protein
MGLFVVVPPVVAGAVPFALAIGRDSLSQASSSIARRFWFHPKRRPVTAALWLLRRCLAMLWNDHVWSCHLLTLELRPDLARYVLPLSAAVQAWQWRPNSKPSRLGCILVVEALHCSLGKSMDQSPRVVLCWPCSTFGARYGARCLLQNLRFAATTVPSSAVHDAAPLLSLPLCVAVVPPLAVGLATC